MRRWWHPAVREADAGQRWTGTALVDAAANIAGSDPADAREVAFAVAEATRDGGDRALRALAALLTAATTVSELDEGALVNVLSALHFASMLPDDARDAWVPPSQAVVLTVERGLASSEAVHEQTDGLLWALVDRRLAAGWLGHDGCRAIALHVRSDELREELIRLGESRETVMSFVAAGDEYPCAA
jgi:hypothetical protein